MRVSFPRHLFSDVSALRHDFSMETRKMLLVLEMACFFHRKTLTAGAALQTFKFAFAKTSFERINICFFVILIDMNEFGFAIASGLVRFCCCLAYEVSEFGHIARLVLRNAVDLIACVVHHAHIMRWRPSRRGWSL